MTPSRGTRVLAVTIILTVLVGPLLVPTGVASGATGSPTITKFTHIGTTVDTGGSVRYLWQGDPHKFAVVIDAGGASGDVNVCLTTKAGGTTRKLTCTTARLATNSSVTASLSLDSWPANVTGPQTVVATVSRSGSPGVLARANQSYTVITRSGDLDGDGLTNADEVKAGTRIDVADTDGDGLTDGQEVHVYHTDPTKADTDGDGLSDGFEVHTSQTNPNKADTDGDGLTDNLEVRKYGTDPNNPDTDGDGLTDFQEVTIYHTNPLVADTDGDGISDAAEVNKYHTDPNSKDTDGDGLTDGQEVHVYHTDPNKADTDGDGLTDFAEVKIYHTNPNKADTDGDGIPDGVEVKQGTDPTVPNKPVRSGVLGAIGTNRLPTTGLLAGGIVIVIAVALLSFRDERIRRRLAGGWSSGRAASKDPPEPPAPSPPMTKEEHIERLLDDHGGQLPQRTIVAETGWSKSTVSRTLSRMEERGQVTKIDVGRGNLITRPGSEPEHSNAPHGGR